MNPDAARAAHPAFPGANREQPDSVNLSPKTLTREAFKVLADLGFDVHPARVRLLVRRFRATGRSDIDFHDWFLDYADPTGETAARNLDRRSG